MTDQELKQLIESNARTAQAMLDSMVEARLEREELRQGIHIGDKLRKRGNCQGWYLDRSKIVRNSI